MTLPLEGKKASKTESGDKLVRSDLPDRGDRRTANRSFCPLVTFPYVFRQRGVAAFAIVPLP